MQLRPVHLLRCVRPFAAVAGVVACLLTMSSSRASADIKIEGDRLTVTTRNITVGFKGADIVKIHNHVTQEEYVRTTTPQPAILDMPMLNPPSKPYLTTGWLHGRSLNANPDAAQISYNDLTRTIWFNVMVDPETQDIVVTLWGSANREGLTGVAWGIRGLDLTSGRLILPALGGRYVDNATAPEDLRLSYPTEWEAQMMVWETAKGGFVMYSRDEQARYKQLRLTRKGSYANLSLMTEAFAPFNLAGDVPQLEWRINAYKGDWRTPSSGYRALMKFFRPPVPASGGRSWVPEIRAVTTIHGDKFDPALLTALAKQLDPKRTLLYLPEWRREGFDMNYPDYDWGENVRDFIDRAHELGFRVMLHANAVAVSPTQPIYRTFRKYQLRDSATGKETGKDWDRPDTDPLKYAIMDPAAKPWRDVFIAQMRKVITELKPDAIHLAGSGTLPNDGAGLIEKKNFAEGMVALHRALLTAFPDVVIGAEGMNELIAPYAWFAQRKGSSALPTHPISSYLFGDHVLPYGELSLPNPDESPAAFSAFQSVYDGQGAIPTIPVRSAADFGPDRTGMRSAMDMARAWQDHAFLPDWRGDLTTARFRWVGQDGTTAVVETQGSATRLKVGDTLLSRRTQGVSQVVTPAMVPGWPAYDDNALYGLDPKQSYPLEESPRPKSALHLSALSPGVTVERAQVTPEFGLFTLSAATKSASESTGSVTVSLPPGSANVGFGGTAGKPVVQAETAKFEGLKVPAQIAVFLKPPVALTAGQDLLAAPFVSADVSGGIATSRPARGPQIAPATCGGVAKARSLVANPPGYGQSVLTWALQLPESDKLALSFSAGLAEGARSTGVGFEVRVNGEKVWEWSTRDSQWKEGTVDLSRWKGQPVVLQLVADAQGDNRFDWARWAEVTVR